jgi:uncharacterized protein YbcI
LPGFDYRYRLSGDEPTVRTFSIKDSGALSRGDMLNFVDGHVELGARGDTALVGAAFARSGRAGGPSLIRVITDADAVYAVEDPVARVKGALLHLTGATGAQGVTAARGSEFRVVLDSAATEETLVTIEVRSHRATTADDAVTRPAGGELSAAIARAVVRLHRDQIGRGPTKARAFFRDNTIVVILEDILSKGERSLVAAGEEEAVLAIRRTFQATMRDSLIATVESLTGCKVVAFMSMSNIDPEMSAELFILDRPVPSEPSS